jgi:hypothetical protein
MADNPLGRLAGRSSQMHSKRLTNPGETIGARPNARTAVLDPVGAFTKTPMPSPEEPWPRFLHGL